MWKYVKLSFRNDYRLIMFDFDNFPIKLSGKTVNYICPKCKYKFEAPIEAVLKFDKRMNEKVYLFLCFHIL